MITTFDGSIRRRAAAIAHALCTLAIAVGMLACSDATGPHRNQVAISGIKVPLVAAQADTIVIEFSPNANACATGLIVDSQIQRDQLRFSASVDTPQSSGPCPAALVVPGALTVQRPFVYIVAPPHVTPFTVRFAQPGRADDVYIVKAP